MEQIPQVIDSIIVSAPSIPQSNHSTILLSCTAATWDLSLLWSLLRADPVYFDCFDPQSPCPSQYLEFCWNFFWDQFGFTQVDSWSTGFELRSWMYLCINWSTWIGLLTQLLMDRVVNSSRDFLHDCFIENIPLPKWCGWRIYNFWYLIRRWNVLIHPFQ